MKKQNQKAWTAWAGFSCGKIAAFSKEDFYSVPADQLEIFTTCKAAKARYQHVEKVEIRIVTKEAK